MSELTEKWSAKFNGQYKQLNENLDKVAKAGRGLFALLKDASTKQFNELVAAGEKTDEDLLDQVKETVKQPFTDIRGSVNKAKFASVGLIVKVKEEGNRYFDELVIQGEKVDQPKATKTTESKSKAKTSVKAA
jgi:polyhydroxyalkanoate synthesis regulator phasin